MTDQRGQVVTEYLLLVAVLVIGTVAAAYLYLPGFEIGVRSLSDDVIEMMATGRVGSLGVDRAPMVAPDLATGAGTNGMYNEEGVFIYPQQVLDGDVPPPEGYVVVIDRYGSPSFIPAYDIY